jgi:hypothetical protein
MNIIGNAIGAKKIISAPYDFEYVSIPSAPSFGATTTHNYTSPGNVTTTGNRDKILSATATWDQVRAFGLAGTVELPYQIKNHPDAVFLRSTATPTNFFDQASTAADFLYVYGEDEANPFHIQGAGIITGGIRFLAPASAGNTLLFQNFVIEDVGIGVHMNDSGTLSGGDANTPCVSTDNYLNIDLLFIRVIDTGTEGFYIGSTSSSAYGIHKDFTGSHLLVINAGWDLFQFNNHLDLKLTNLTGINGGLLNQAAQNQLFQFQNTKGYCRNSIFADAPHMGLFATLDFEFTNNYVEWSDGFPGLIADYYGNYTTSQRLMVTDAGILIDDCDFVNTNASSASSLFDVQDDVVTVTIQNCRIENVDDLFEQGTDGVRLIDGGGNTFVPVGTIERPTFSSTSVTDYATHGLLTSEYHHALGRGYRTP